MTRRSLALFVLALVLLALAGGTAASTARAGGGATGLIKDASDGVVNGTYSAATVRSALSMVRSDPAYTMYSDIEGVLVDYLASITNPDGGGGGGGSGGGSTPLPVDENTPGTSGSSSSGGKATPSATPGTKHSPDASGTRTPTPASSASGVPLSPSPSATAWDQAKSRLAAAPWLFVLPLAAIVAVGVILLRRRRRSA